MIPDVPTRESARITAQRNYNIARCTLLGAVMLGFGLFLFGIDMRTIGVAPHHQLVIDLSTVILAVVSLLSGVATLAIRRRLRQIDSRQLEG